MPCLQAACGTLSSAMTGHLVTGALLLVLTAVAGSEGATRFSVASHVRYLDALREHFSHVRHPVAGTQQWLAAREAVRAALLDKTRRVAGAYLDQQVFNTTVMKDGSKATQVRGENIVAVFPGQHRHTSGDRVLVIGAHYDSDAFTLGVDDNGSGVVALLELARRVAATLETGGTTANVTVVLVAFDLQTREHIWPADSVTGAQVFVNKYLGPQLLQGELSRFEGAIILDSILNYNNASYSQHLPVGFDKTFPAATQDIKLHDLCGDFLAVVSRNISADSDLLRQVKKHWSQDKFRLLPLTISTGTRPTEALFRFLKQDHLPFWNYQPQEENDFMLPAVLLTDTGTLRRGPSDAPSLLSIDDFVTPEKLDFLDHTVTAIESIILETTERSGQSAAKHSAVSVSIVFCLGLLMSRLLY